jgi:hypothetical protein
MRAFLALVLLCAACAQPAARPPAAETPGSESRTAFWIWFAAHKDEVATIQATRTPIVDSLVAELHKVDPRLTYEVGNNMQPREIIITADGNKDGFPAVITLAAAAPVIPGWKVIPFRQPQAHDSVEVGGVLLKTEDIYFHATPVEDHRLALMLWVKPTRELTPRILQLAGLLVDSAVGEYDLATRLAGMEMQKGEPPPEAQPLRELAKRVDALK